MSIFMYIYMFFIYLTCFYPISRPTDGVLRLPACQLGSHHGLSALLDRLGHLALLKYPSSAAVMAVGAAVAAVGAVGAVAGAKARPTPHL